ncbi:MAG TPA: hypothetical protein VG755_10475 [Nannocystaceae bacterium]|nr:hypothetical protein [Nannocystaceae bacterium]
MSRQLCAFVLATLFACVELGPYRCEDTSDCVHDGEAGTCTDEGWCAYADDDCPGGLRYSELAGDGLARACVDDTASCGDQSTQGDEECDDGNAVDGDGCNADCTRSGAVVWSTLVPGSDGARDFAEDLVVLAGGDAIVVGGLEEGGAQQAFVARVAADDGSIAWRWTSQGEWDEGFANGVALDADNRIGVCGSSVSSEGEHGWLAVFAPDGARTWLVQTTGGSASDLVGNVEGFVVTSATFDGTFGGVVAAFDGTSAKRWEVLSGLAEENVYTAITSRGFDDVVTVSTFGEDIALQRIDGASATTIATYGGDFGDRDVAQGIAIHPSGDLLAAGFETTAFGHDPWLARLTDLGAEVWVYRETIAPTPVDEELEDVVADPAGNIFAVGFVTNDDKDAYLAKYAPDGTRIFTRVYGDPATPGDDAARAVALAPEGGVLVAGEAQGDLWIAKLGP